ncbi:MAG: B-box zinc finger protein [Candidatus Micrarchaeota archaeon]|nr:B-box zinc finger protein [Candidatus Micrarchaeota archaeon]
MDCANHPERDALANCVNCGKPFCENCLERVGKNYICLDCLEEVLKRSLKERAYGRLTARLAVGGGVFLTLAAITVISQLWSLGEVLSSMLADLALFLHNLLPQQVGDAMVASLMPGTAVAGREKLAMAMEFAKAGLYAIEGYGLLMNRGWAYWLGVVLCISIMTFRFNDLVSGAFSNAPLAVVIMSILAPLALLGILLTSKRDLIP